jgi:hypothetical protein
METRDYYSERKGFVKVEKIGLDSFKKLSLQIFRQLKREFYFREAEGWYCVDDGHRDGVWGSSTDEIESTFFLQLKIENLYPIEEHIKDYDEATLFSVIEFLYDYVSEPQTKTYHNWNNCGWHTYNYDAKKGKQEYQKRVNEILRRYSKGYELSNTGEIQEIAPTGLETLLEETIHTKTPESIEDRIQHAKDKFRRYNASLNDKRDALRELAAVLEFLKKDDITLSKKR